MPRMIQTLPTADFRGGINYMSDAFQLKDNEVTDALNVDFDPAGGFKRRYPSQTINTTAIVDGAAAVQTPKNIWTFTKSDGSANQIIAQAGNDFAYSTGGNFTTVNPDALACTGVMYAATAQDNNYIQRNAERAVVKWTGAASSVLADSHGAYNDNLAAPAGGKMPIAKYICRHRNYLFHAVINEAGTLRRSRVRFSHPFSDITATKGVEDYRTNDWLEVGLGDGDTITGMASFGGDLIVFKTNSTWVVRGYGPDSFAVENISMTVGAISQRAIAVGAEGVYFFAWPDGLCLYDGKQIHNVFHKIRPIIDRTMTGTAIDNLQIDANHIDAICIGYINNRVWVACPSSLGGTGVNDMTFVYDPMLADGGGWTRYNLPFGAFTSLHTPGTDRKWYAVCTMIAGEVHEVENHVNGWLDKMGTNLQGYTCFLYTKWYDLGNPAVKKRWKHPIFVVDALYTESIDVRVYKDYDFSNAIRFFTLNVTAPAVVTWGGSTWGGSVWSPATLSGAQSIEKGGLLGSATAIALMFDGPSTLPWAVNSITWKYIPRKVRS